jgi:hypothetical protein
MIFGIVRYAQYLHGRKVGTNNTSDWLFNYQGGFVRRGLSGQLIYWLHQSVLGWVSIHRLAIVIPVLLYLACGGVYTAVALTIRDRWLAWVLLSPAALLWTSYNVEAGYRKELLFELLLGLLVLAVRVGRHESRLLLLAAALVIYLIYMLSWEPAVFLLPTILFLVFHCFTGREGDLRRALIIGIIVGSIATFGLETLFHGTEQTVAGICRSLRQSGVNVGGMCTANDQGIKEFHSLASTPSEQLHKVAGLLPAYFEWFIWLPVSMLPFLAGRWLWKMRWIAAIQLLLMAPLFIFATDWGRWIHIYVLALSALWFASAPGESSGEETAKITSSPVMLVGLVLWVSMWGFYYNLFPLKISSLLTSL